MARNTKRQNKTLSHVQEQKLPILVAAPTISKGAEDSGIDRSTVYRWLEQPLFKAEFNRLSRAKRDRAFDEIRLLSNIVVMVYGQALTSSNESIRLAAANKIYDSLVHERETDELLSRIKKLLNEEDI